MVTVPVIFVVGVLTSMAIESLGKSNHVIFSYVKHLMCAILCAILFSFTSSDLLITAFYVSIVYVTTFFIIDCIIKNVEKRKEQVITN
ncbi:hypothetical protein [Neobacillus sp.]|uniref:hypothetical protein n=1 Tax=Neobacillus sp. TaxID=2675273 RepID=UPI0028A05A45|nr:hypothetical protein [Neobacillus sp.]